MVALWLSSHYIEHLSDTPIHQNRLEKENVLNSYAVGKRITD